MNDLVFCQGCGKEIHRKAATCPHCEIARLQGPRYKSKVIGMLAILIGIFVALAIPAIKTYTLRAKVSAAHTFAKQAASDVTAYVQAKQKLPASLSEAGFKLALPRDVRSMELDNRGTIMIVMTGAQPINGKSFAMRGSSSGGSISFRCEGVDLPERYLPEECRR
jgi:Tfp pilus assembly protein PilE